MNLRRVKGKAVGECTFCGSFAGCQVFIDRHGREYLVCGSDACQERLTRQNGTVHRDADLSLRQARRAQGRDEFASTER